MKHVYIAGPFTAKTDIECEANIVRAEAAAASIIAADPEVVCIIPHAIGRNFKHGPGTPQYWYDATMSMLSRCDAIVMLPGWEGSKGSVREYEYAVENNMPICIYEEKAETYTRHFPATEYERGLLEGVVTCADAVKAVLS